MARGLTLGTLTDQLRLAARYDPNPALSLNVLPMMQQLLRDTQERLYDEFDWPFLKITRDKILAAGQRYYDIPTDINLERILAVDVRYGDQWLPVERGIDVDHYNAHDSDADVRIDPVVRWDVKDTGTGEQVEVWPIPVSNGLALRFKGIRKLTPMIETADRADIDSQLIVLFAAGELLGGAKNPQAQLKINQASHRLEVLQGRVTKTRNNSFVLGGDGAPEARDTSPRTPQVAYVRNP
jgi:hypothetical protein